MRHQHTRGRTRTKEETRGEGNHSPTRKKKTLPDQKQKAGENQTTTTNNNQRHKPPHKTDRYKLQLISTAKTEGMRGPHSARELLVNPAETICP